MKVDLDDITSRTLGIKEYIQLMDKKEQDAFMEFYNQYELDATVTNQLKKNAQDMTIVVLSASWCIDCTKAIPVLMHLEEKIGLKVRVFGNMKTAPLDPEHQWKIPPSPPEVEKWNVTAIPWIEIFDKDGKQLTTIIEKPKNQSTLEGEIFYVLNQL